MEGVIMEGDVIYEGFLDVIDWGCVIDAVPKAKIWKLLVICKAVFHLLRKLIGEFFKFIDKA